MKFSSRWLEGQVFPCRRSIGSHIGPMLINFYHSVYERLIEMKSLDCWCQNSGLILRRRFECCPHLPWM